MSDVPDQLKYLLEAGKVRDALEMLNGTSNYRFTALFRFRGDALENLLLVDRERTASPFPTFPIGDSYCTFVQSSMQPFLVEDSSDDARVAGHPKQPVVRAYLGLPLLAADGASFGTLCHFDFDPVDAQDGVLELMQVVGRHLMPSSLQAALMVDFNRRVDTLAQMLRAIDDSSVDAAESDAAFDEYAKPIREAAHRELDRENADRIDDSLDEMRSGSRRDG